jgi:hypothetical protein
MAVLTGNMQLASNLRLAVEYNAGVRRYTPHGLDIFNTIDPQRRDEMFAIHTGLGLLVQVSEDAAYPLASMVEFGSVTASQLSFKKALPVSLLMKRFDANYNAIAAEVSNAGFRLSQTKDNVMAGVIRGSASTTLVFDSLSLFNASHKIGTSGLTQSNVTTGGYSDANVIAAIQKLYEQRDHDNIVGSYEVATLVTPPALSINAKRTLQSSELFSVASGVYTMYHNPLNSNPNIDSAASTQVIRHFTWNLLGAVNSAGSDTTSYLFSQKNIHRLNYLEKIAPQMSTATGDSTHTGGDIYRFDYAAVACAVDYVGTNAITT